ncbi:MAG: Calx-beta domain-containing protein [Jatrophihabitantaceae bacterium]
MKTVRRCITLLAATGLCLLAVPATSQARPTSQPAASRSHGTVVSVRGETSYEYVKSCANTTGYPCGTYNAQLEFTIYTTNQGSGSITVGYQTVDGSATAGSDYQAASGTVTIQHNFPQAYVLITIYNDSVAESTESMQLKLTSSSSPADISSVGTGTILDAGQIPIDCNLGKTAPNQESMTCTNRPAGQSWYLDVICAYPLGDPELLGNLVTGNGTSAGTCNVGNTTPNSYFQTS